MRWGRSLGAVLLWLSLLAGQLLLPFGSQAREISASPQALAAKITHLYAWARPSLIKSNYAGTEYSLDILVGSKAGNLSQGAGANLMMLYVTQLKNQKTYRLTMYSVAAGGAAAMQYLYIPSEKLLQRTIYLAPR